MAQYCNKEDKGKYKGKKKKRDQRGKQRRNGWKARCAGRRGR